MTLSYPALHTNDRALSQNAHIRELSANRCSGQEEIDSYQKIVWNGRAGGEGRTRGCSEMDIVNIVGIKREREKRLYHVMRKKIDG